MESINKSIYEGKYTESLVAYIDILGYKGMLLDKDNIIRNIQEVSQAMKCVRKSLEEEYYNENRKKLSYFIIRTFSDNILISCPIHYLEDGELETWVILRAISKLQCYLAKYNIFVRGVLNYMKIYIDGNIIFGKDLISMLEIEKKKVIYPRVILSESMTELINKQLESYGFEEYPHKYNLVEDRDGLYFVNYLIESLSQETLIIEDVKILEEHKNNIEKNKTKHLRNNTIYDKYNWIAKYHNYFIDTYCSDNEKDKSKYKLKNIHNNMRSLEGRLNEK